MDNYMEPQPTQANVSYYCKEHIDKSRQKRRFYESSNRNEKSWLIMLIIILVK